MSQIAKASILSVCLNPDCMHVFSSWAVSISGGGSITIPTGSHGSPCPKCHGPYATPGGRFTATDTGMLFVPNSDADRDLIENALKVIHDAIGGIVPPEIFKREAKKRAERLSRLWDLMPENREEAYQFWLLLVAVIGLLLVAKPDAPQQIMIPKDVIDAIRAAQQPAPDKSRNEQQEQQQQ